MEGITNQENIPQDIQELSSPREIVLVDIDAFHYQVMIQDLGRPDLEKQPVIVINKQKKIVAVNYVAKSFGIDRDDTHLTARNTCPELVVLEIPQLWNKADQRTPRLQSYRIFDSIKEFFNKYKCNVNIEYSSKDEFFIDLTEIVTKMVDKKAQLRASDFYEKTIIEAESKISGNGIAGILHQISAGQSDEIRLLHATVVAGEAIAFLKAETGYQASAGVGTNKLHAKIACGHNKPKAVTVFLPTGLLRLSKEIEFSCIPALGGKKGKRISAEFRNSNETSAKTIFDLSQIPVEKLIERFGAKDGLMFSKLAKGSDDSVVTNKSAKAEIICGRIINPVLRTRKDVVENIWNFAEELKERLDEERNRHRRRPHHIKIKVTRTKIEGKRLQSESGTFKCSPRPTVKEILRKSMIVVDESWTNYGQRPLNKIKKMALIATQFVPLEEDLA